MNDAFASHNEILTLIFHRKPGFTTEDRDLGLVTFEHQGAEHGARRSTVRISDLKEIRKMIVDKW